MRFFVRRRRDLNPRAAINDLHPFQGCPFGQLGYFSKVLESCLTEKLCPIFVCAVHHSDVHYSKGLFKKQALILRISLFSKSRRLPSLTHPAGGRTSRLRRSFQIHAKGLVNSPKACYNPTCSIRRGIEVVITRRS